MTRSPVLWYVVGPDDLCACPVYPVNNWWAGTELVGTRIIDEDASPSGDAAAFIESGADSWTLSCPACGRVFASGRYARL